MNFLPSSLRVLEQALPLSATFAVQASVLLLLSITILKTLGRRWSAANRHVLLVATSLLIPCLIPTSQALQNHGLSWGLIESTQTSPIVPANIDGSWKIVSIPSAASPPEAATAASYESNPANAAPTSTESFWASAEPGLAIVLIWLAGSAFGASWLLLGLIQLSIASWTGKPAHPELQLALHRQINQWAPSTSVRVISGRSKEIPMTWGIFHHIVTLPPEAIEWSASTLRTVLRHELCHIARKDFLWLTLSRFCLVLCWFHPLAWWLARELSRTAEHSSDDLATRTTSGRASYARKLLEVVSHCQNDTRLQLTSPFRLALAMATRSSALRRRVESLMNGQQDRTPYRRHHLLWQLPACIVMALSVGSITACKKELPEPSKESEPSAATETAPPPETRVYRLSENQRKNLTGGTMPIGTGNPSQQPVDPFGNNPTPRPATTPNEKQLKSLAWAARFHLINVAHVSSRPDRPPQVVMPDSRTLLVTADEETHNAIAKYLAQDESGEQVMIRSFVLEVDPGWLPWRELGLEEPSNDRLQVQGILSQEAGQKLMSVIRSDKTVQGLTAAPAVTTRSGQRTHVDMVREFIYPTEFDPPYLLQPPAAPVGTNANDTKGTLARSPIPANFTTANLPIIPTTPTAFEMRPVGLRLEFDPVVSPAKTHEIQLYWEITDFLGFINYGTPIKTVAKDRDGKDQELIISENKIQQPVFESLKLTTSFTVPDGNYVVIGGIKPERQAPAMLDESSPSKPIFTSKSKPTSGSPGISKPSMYILILQPTLLKNPEKEDGREGGSR